MDKHLVTLLAAFLIFTSSVAGKYSKHIHKRRILLKDDVSHINDRQTEKQKKGRQSGQQLDVRSRDESHIEGTVIRKRGHGSSLGPMDIRGHKDRAGGHKSGSRTRFPSSTNMFIVSLSVSFLSMMNGLV
ncbi:hypothetical protein KP509_17G024000 [Ceratopteris richardii]|uniref:Uncharacterized protein n=1 Tax=Ceratopteris richardii TaxID=49495 RepID=A0A8T2SSU5_CERRI|nr:hypothetical protein KP509_17G024000 [Ceratopteris richardii]